MGQATGSYGVYDITDPAQRAAADAAAPTVAGVSENQSINAIRDDAADAAQYNELSDADKASDAGNGTASGFAGHDYNIRKATPAANVGGYAGGINDMKAAGIAGMNSNNGEQAANSAAMAQSVANMTANRGPQAAENASRVAATAGARSQQTDALSALRAQATGNAPSAAAYQTQAGMNANMGQMSGMLGSAKGLAGLNGAQTSGAGMMASNANNVATQGAQGRAGEIATAMGQYGAGAGNLRDNDLSRLKTSDQSALFNTGLNDQWKLGNANLAAKQGQLGLAQGQTDQSWYTAAMDPTYRQLSYDQQMNAIQNGASAQDAAADFARQQQQQQQTRQLIGGAVQGGLTAVGSLAGPGGTAAGSVLGGMANSAIGKYS